MNYLSIDYGLKRIGLAYSLNNIIFTLPQVENNKSIFSIIQTIITEYQIDKVFVGLSEGEFGETTKKFVEELKNVVTIPVETIEESVSTIESDKLYKSLKNPKKDYKKNIDSFSAAVILGRAIGYN